VSGETTASGLGPQASGAIEVQDFSFSYGAREVLKHISPGR